MRKIKQGVSLPSTIIWSVVIFVVVLSFELLAWWQYPQQLIATSIQPIVKFDAWLISRVNQSIDRVKFLKNTTQRIQDLERELAFAQASMAEMQALKEENSNLRKKLKVVSNDDSQIVTFTLSSFIRPTIAAGSNHGLEPGLPVLIDGTLVGLVEEVKPRYAFIKLLKDFTDEAILVKTAGGAEGLLRGDGRRILLTELTMMDEVDLRDQLVTLGQPGIPRGLSIGWVQTIDRDPAAFEQFIIIEQGVDFYQNTLVEVLLADQTIDSDL